MVLAFLTLCPSENMAQILNIERLRMKADSTQHFFMKANVGMRSDNRSAAEDEPVNFFGYHANLNLLFTSQNHGYIFVGQMDYLEINDAQFINFGFAHARINFLRKRKLSYEVFTQISYDNFRGLEPRTLLGGGLRYKVLNGEKADLSAGLGAFLEDERWRHPIDDKTVEITLAKMATYVRYQVSLSDYVNFNAMVYYQGGYDSGADVFRNRVSGSFNLSSKLSSRISLNNSFDVSYEDKPIVPITKTIYALRIGVGIDI